MCIIHQAIFFHQLDSDTPPKMVFVTRQFFIPRRLVSDTKKKIMVSNEINNPRLNPIIMAQSCNYLPILDVTLLIHMTPVSMNP